MKQPDWPSLHLPKWFQPHVPHAGELLPYSATLPWDWAGLALKFFKFQTLYSHMFLGVDAQVDDGALSFCF